MPLTMVGTAFQRLRYEVRGRVAQWPALYLPLARVRRRFRPGPVPVSKAADIVIEGFPRSGNTFAVVAFRMAQKRPLVIAHHFHAPAQIIAAARWGIPTLLLIRDPEQAVLSHAIWVPSVTLRQALRSYVSFYRCLRAYADSYLLAPFEQVTGDFGEVIRRANERFGTDFEEFDHTQENVEECFALMEQATRERLGDGEHIERFVARPSGHRAELKQRLRRDLERAALRDLLEEARRVHSLYVPDSSPQ